MKDAENLRASPVQTRPAEKVAGLLGARDRGEDMDLRSNVNQAAFIQGAAARRLLNAFEELDFKLFSPLIARDVEDLRSRIAHIVLVQPNLVGLETNPFPHLLNSYRMLADNIERLKLPVVVLGLGVNVRPGADIAYNVHDDVLRLLRVLSAHSKAIAVRGEFSAQALNKLGIDNVKLVGCQSLFWHRQPILSHLLEGTSSPERPTAFNFTRGNVEHKLVNQAMEADFDLIGQGMSAEEALVQRRRADGGAVAYLGPTEMALAQNLINRERYEAWARNRFFQFSDAYAWVDHMRRYRGAYGTRFHGNMAAYIAGVPALWITHDTRTEEMCDLFRLPAVKLSDVQEGVDLETIYEKMDYSECVKVYPERYRGMLDYLNEAGVNHTLRAPAEASGAPPRDGYPWIFRAARETLAKSPPPGGAPKRVLSFGCAQGDEAFVLADKYFPEARVLGVDIAADRLEIATLSNPLPERIVFDKSTPEALRRSGPFDAIFAMNVLCAWPATKDKDDISKLYSFDRFEKLVAMLDQNLVVGGLLTIYNANYRFRDTKFWNAYELVPGKWMPNSGFVNKFDRSGIRQPEFDADTDIIFRKRLDTPTL